MSRSIDDHLSALAFAERSFAAGEFVFHLNDEVRSIHQIVDGEVHLLRRREDGAAIILQRARFGALLAEASLFSERYHCDAIAISPTRTRSFPKRLIRAGIVDRPDFAEAWATHLAREVQEARLRAEILSLRRVSARLDAWLAWNGGRLPARGDWKNVAGEIGTSPEALYREIARRRHRASIIPA